MHILETVGCFRSFVCDPGQQRHCSHPTKQNGREMAGEIPAFLQFCSMPLQGVRQCLSLQPPEVSTHWPPATAGAGHPRAA